MSARAHATDGLEAVDYVIAFAVGLLALLGFVALSMARGKQLAQANISDENAKYVKVAIAPVSDQGALKGNKTAALPNAWQRKKPPPEALRPPKDDTPPPNTISSSSAAPADTSKKPPPDAAAPQPEEDASAQALDIDAASVDIEDASTAADAELAVASDIDGAASGDGGTPGVEQGTGNGLHDSYIGRYRSALQSFFTGRFYPSCARLPPESKDGIHATAVIRVTGRQMTGFSVNGSGNAAFDGEVNGTLTSSQALPLPAPPDPIASEIVDKPITLSFSCPKATTP